MTTYGDDPSLVYNDIHSTTKNFDNLFLKKSELHRSSTCSRTMKISTPGCGKPYKFYMMFHEHGCAKTSVIKAIASRDG
jgi:hypothetical protein